MSRRGVRLATSVVTALLAAPAGALLLRAAPGPAGPGPATVDDVVATAVMLGGAAVLAWYAVTAVVTSVCLTARLAGGAWHCGERAVRAAGAPLMRRVVTLGAGAAVAVGAVVSPALADVSDRSLGGLTSEVVDRAPVADDLGWGADADAPTTTSPGPSPGDAPPSEPVPDPTTPPQESPPPPTNGPTNGPTTPTDPDAQPTDGPGPADGPVPPESSPDGQAAPPDGSTGTHVVVAGESLWTIAAGHLGPDATPEQTATAWPRWYEANAAAVGADPDLIHPGQVLAAPDHSHQEDA